MTKQQHKRKMLLRRYAQNARRSDIYYKPGKYPGFKLREINALKGV